MTTSPSHQRSRQSADQQVSTPSLERLRTFAVCSGVFVLALGLRGWTSTWLTDFWGDSYHHWLITRLTMGNGGVYSDYKGMEVVWSPLYHYVSILPLWLSGRTDIVPLHWMNILFGSLACAMAAHVSWRLYANRAAAWAAGAVLAMMTWHIAFSGMNVAEVFSGVLLLAVVTVVWSMSPGALGAEHTPRSPRAPHVPRARVRHWVLLLLLAVVMSLTRPDLPVFLGIIGLWLGIHRRYTDAAVLTAGVLLALAGWSLWSYSRTGNLLHWYQQYLRNNRRDWVLLEAPTPDPAFAFADYLVRHSPLVLPALAGGVLCAVTWRGAQRRDVWLLTALLAGHCSFLIVGYARGVVPLLTERYLALDLPLIAVLMGGWVVLVGDWVAASARRFDWRDRVGKWAGRAVAAFLITLTAVRFWNDIPELEVRRWEIDPEWQVGSYLAVHVEPGDVVLTDAPVAMYRSGRAPSQFISSVQLPAATTPSDALVAAEVDWIVTQPRSYDATSSFVPRALLEAHVPGTAGGLRFEPVWRYDPRSTEIQPEVWRVSREGSPPAGGPSWECRFDGADHC